jgi:hypothetical protein
MRRPSSYDRLTDPETRADVTMLVTDPAEALACCRMYSLHELSHRRRIQSAGVVVHSGHQSHNHRQCITDYVGRQPALVQHPNAIHFCERRLRLLALKPGGDARFAEILQESANSEWHAFAASAFLVQPVGEVECLLSE